MDIAIEKESQPSNESILKIVPTRIRHNDDDDFFVEGNLSRLRTYTCLPLVKNFPINEINMNIIDDDNDDEFNNNYEFCCKWPRCKAKFTSVIEYDRHLFDQHNFTCSLCLQTFPTNHLLDIHLVEIHDSYFKARVDKAAKIVAQEKEKKKEMIDCDDCEESISTATLLYVCLVEGCRIKSASKSTRCQHLIQCHLWPESSAKAWGFPNSIGKGKGKGKRKEKKRINRTEYSKEEEVQVQMQVQVQVQVDAETDDMDLEQAMNKMNINLPQKLSFGRKRR